MATYKQVQEIVSRKYGWTPKTCWIADVKERMGIPMRKAWNRSGETRKNPCPSDKRQPISIVIKELQKMK